MRGLLAKIAEEHEAWLEIGNFDEAILLRPVARLLQVESLLICRRGCRGQALDELLADKGIRELLTKAREEHKLTVPQYGTPAIVHLFTYKN